MNELEQIQSLIDAANIFTELRMVGFEEEDIEELKLTKRPLEHLKKLLWNARALQNQDILDTERALFDPVYQQLKNRSREDHE